MARDEALRPVVTGTVTVLSCSIYILMQLSDFNPLLNDFSFQMSSWRIRPLWILFQLCILFVELVFRSNENDRALISEYDQKYPNWRTWSPCTKRLKMSSLCRLLQFSQEAKHEWIFLGIQFFYLSAFISASTCGLATFVRFAANRNFETPMIQFDDATVQVFVALVVQDFLYYVWHRSHHKFLWLWESHSYHHSMRKFNVVSGFRNHPFEVY